MKSHKYWSFGAMFTMIGTFYTGYKNQKNCSQIFCHEFIALHDNGNLYRS